MRTTNFVANQGTYFKVFTNDQCREIHFAALEILESVGVEMRSEEARQLLKEAGALIEGNIVKIPASMVEKALKTAPSRVVLANRDGERTIFLEGHKYYFGPGPTTTYVIDPLTKERRFGKYSDTKRAARVMDALENIDFLMDFGTIYDVPEKLIDVYTFEAMLTSSKKPIVHWAYNVRNCQAMIDMASEIFGGLEYLQRNPNFAIYTEPITPLVHEFNALDISMLMAKNGLPSVYTPAPQAGVTAPATLAGTIVISLCESLSGLVVNQLTKEGAPFVMGGVITIMDPRSMQITYGSPEINILSAGLSDMAHYYNIPMFSTAGCVDAKIEDQQSSAEMATNLLMAVLSGGNLIHDIGYFESGISTSMLNLVMANELLGCVKRIARGIEVNKDTLAVDVIRRVGPGGNFMAEEHTAEHFRKEWWLPELMNRDRYYSWKESGEKTFGDVCQERLEEIIKNYTVEELPKDTLNKFKKIIEELKKNL